MIRARMLFLIALAQLAGGCSTSAPPTPPPTSTGSFAVVDDQYFVFSRPNGDATIYRVHGDQANLIATEGNEMRRGLLETTAAASRPLVLSTKNGDIV